MKKTFSLYWIHLICICEPRAHFLQSAGLIINVITPSMLVGRLIRTPAKSFNSPKENAHIQLQQTRSHKFTFSLKWISTNFPKRLLLLFRTVFAFPKASSNGFAAGVKNTNYFLLLSLLHEKKKTKYQKKWILMFSHAVSQLKVTTRHLVGWRGTATNGSMTVFFIHYILISTTTYSSPPYFNKKVRKRKMKNLDFYFSDIFLRTV